MTEEEIAQKLELAAKLIEEVIQTGNECVYVVSPDSGDTHPVCDAHFHMDECVSEDGEEFQFPGLYITLAEGASLLIEE